MRYIFMALLTSLLMESGFSQLDYDCQGDIRTLTTDWTREAEQINYGQAKTNDWSWTAWDDLRYDVVLNGQPDIIMPPFYPDGLLYNPDGTFNIQNVSNSTLGNIDRFYESLDNSEMFELLDYYVSDGWELITKNLNHSTQSDFTYVNFILYNRYSGVIRVFYYLGDDIEANELVIKMMFKHDRGNESYQRTALFSHLNPVMQPVERFNFLNEFEVSVGDVATGGDHWVYADFPAAYDPCTCGANAEIQIAAHYVNTRTVTLEGTITGTQQAVVPGSSGGNGGEQIGFGEGLSNVNSIFSAANKGYKATTDAAKAYRRLVDRAEDNEAESPTSSASDVLDGTFFGGDAWKSVGDIISLGLNSTSALSAVGTVANLFISGWKKAKGNNASAPPIQMEVNLGVSMSGSIEEELDHSEITIRLPGSKVEDSNADTRAPFYDNVLGVFNVIEQPEPTRAKLVLTGQVIVGCV